ncbi:sensor histidine kinase, partial [Rubrivirga sp.]|uniref:sensor histidine kinase n=1 Tax=Rubrivirga sp. TaxID=1885344 RepID=UPI003C755AB6
MSHPTLLRFWRRYRVRVVGRLVVLVAAGVGIGIALEDAGAASVGIAVGLVAVALRVGWRIIHTVERPARDLRRFLEGVRYDDMSGHVSVSGDDPLMVGLAEAFESVGEAFRTVRAEREEQAGYLEAVVRHVGVALIAFRTDGTVTLFNLAARRMLAVPRPRSLQALSQRAPETVRALRDLPTGDRTLIRLEQDAGPQELVAYATRFTVSDEMHTLVSLQDIRQELEARELEAWQQLTRVLTHEITNSVAPISSLAGTALGLMDTADASHIRTDDVREALGTIERRSRGLVSFVDTYRTLAKLPQPTPRVIEAGELLGDIAILARASGSGVEVVLEVEPPQLEIVADPDLIEQALVNLSLNAVQALGGRPGA